MKKRTVLIAVTLAALATGAGPAAGGTDKTYAPKDCNKPSIAPKRIVFFCGDGGAYINRLDWKKFGKRHARGRGVLKERESCTPPMCPSNHFDRYPAKIRLFKVRSKDCGGRRVSLYTHAELHFPGKRPDDAKTFRNIELFCNP